MQWAASLAGCWLSLGQLGLQNGVERMTKIMMGFLFVILVVLCVRSITLEGAGAGLSFYLVPDFGKVVENGIGEVVFAAMGQSYFEPWYRSYGYLRKLYQ